MIGCLKKKHRTRTAVPNIDHGRTAPIKISVVYKKKKKKKKKKNRDDFRRNSAQPLHRSPNHYQSSHHLGSTPVRGATTDGQRHRPAERRKIKISRDHKKIIPPRGSRRLGANLTLQVGGTSYLNLSNHKKTDGRAGSSRGGAWGGNLCRAFAHFFSD